MRRLVLVWLLLGLNLAYAQNIKPIAQKVSDLNAQHKFVKAPDLFTISNEKPIANSIVENAGFLNDRICNKIGRAHV